MPIARLLEGNRISPNKELDRPRGFILRTFSPEREVTLTPEWKQHTVRLETPGP